MSEHLAEEPAPCVFCDIVAGRAPAQMVDVWPDAAAFVPLNPVTEGHVLVVPFAHVAHALVDPVVTAVAFARAAELARGRRRDGTGAARDVNLITSCGEVATQTIRHLHVHVVPRRAGDGLPLPWSPQQDRLRGADLLVPGS